MILTSSQKAVLAVLEVKKWKCSRCVLRELGGIWTHQGVTANLTAICEYGFAKGVSVEVEYPLGVPMLWRRLREGSS